MAKKYYWTREEEARLLGLCQNGVRDPQVLAKELGCKTRAVLAKLNRLGVVVVKQNFQRTTTTEVTDMDLLTHEETLEVLAGALELLRQRAHVSHNIGELWSM